MVLGPADSAGSDAGARAVAERFGAALTAADSGSLRALLPREGKVQLRLVRMGPEQGFFSAEQVQALLRDFLRHGAVHRFEIARIEQSADGIALARTWLDLTDARGKRCAVELHVVVQLEAGRWVLREIREIPS